MTYSFFYQQAKFKTLCKLFETRLMENLGQGPDGHGGISLARVEAGDVETWQIRLV
jgi:hypothetical protein